MMWTKTVTLALDKMLYSLWCLLKIYRLNKIYTTPGRTDRAKYQLWIDLFKYQIELIQYKPTFTMSGCIWISRRSSPEDFGAFPASSSFPAPELPSSGKSPLRAACSAPQAGWSGPGIVRYTLHSICVSNIRCQIS